MQQSSVQALTELAVMAALAPEDRATVAKDLTVHLGSDWVPEGEAGDGVGLRHLPTGLAFVAVPGGEFRMGITDDDLAAVATFRTAVPDGESFQQVLAFGRPVRTVRVLPFLWSRTLVAVDAAGGVSARRNFDHDAVYDRAQAMEAAARYGFRLPSEAEFEWVARHGGSAAFLNDSLRPLDDAQTAALLAELEDDPDYDVFDDHLSDRDGPSRFGVEGLFCRQWLADDWHPSFEGAPDTSEPWLDGDPQGVRRGDGETTGVDFNWPHVAFETFHHLLAGLREPGGTPLMYCERENRVGLRFAAPLEL